MDKNRYMISEAANIVNVESHVLRYWEDELELAIPRNEMGHRYYTRENLDEFQQIKELKEEGYQLKAIKMILKNSDKEIVCTKDQDTPEIAQGRNESKLEQFQNLMNLVVRNAIAQSNREMGLEVTDKIIKEMNYLMRMQDEQDEERYKKLDEAIREFQKSKHKDKKETGKTKIWKPKLTT